MLRNSVAIESINGFAPEQTDVSPEEPIFVLTSSQLQEIITRAIQPLQDRIETLEVIVARLGGIEAKFEALEKDMDSLVENDLNQLRLINDLRSGHATMQPSGDKTMERIAKIDDILKVNGSTSFKELGRLLKIRPQEMSRIVAKLDKRRYEIFFRAGDDRQKVLRLKVQIVNVKR